MKNARSGQFRRWLKFNLVGAIGMAFQFAILALLTIALRVHYLLATALAVECTVLHNFLWHERFTWADRKLRHTRAVAARLLHFNLTTGAISIGGNLLFMRILVGAAHAPLLLANCASVAACSVVNYLVNDRWVFGAASPARRTILRAKSY
ncbi:MAG: GtrA family protein [Candidatus Acidiferrales bacterium]